MCSPLPSFWQVGEKGKQRFDESARERYNEAPMSVTTHNTSTVRGNTADIIERLRERTAFNDIVGRLLTMLNKEQTEHINTKPTEDDSASRERLPDTNIISPLGINVIDSHLTHDGLPFKQGASIYLSSEETRSYLDRGSAPVQTYAP